MHITIDPYISTDYVGESMAFNLELTRINARDTLAQVALEAQIILEHVLDIDVVMEASPNEQKANSTVRKGGAAVGNAVKGTASAAASGTKAVGKTASTAGKVALAPAAAAKGAHNVTKGAINKGKSLVEKVKNFFKKIIDFVKNMFVRFKDNMQTLFQNSAKWVLDRESEFGDIDYTDLSTDLVPYWDGPKNRALTLVTRDLRTAGIGTGKNLAAMMAKDGEGITTLAGFQEKYMGDYILEGDLKEGLLNYYRVGNKNGADRVTMKGNAIYSRITKDIIPYIKNFDKIMREAEQEMNTVDVTLSRIMNGLNERNIAMESYSELFREDMRDTEFAHHDEFMDIVGENTKVKDSSDTDRTKAGVNSVARDNRSTSEKEEDNANSQLDQQVSQGSDKQVKVLFNFASTQQLATSCYITALDERFTAYINLLKSIWKAGNVRGGRDPGKEKRQKEEAENNK